MVTIKEDGIERRVTAAEAFLLHLTKRGLEFGGAAATYAMAALEKARAARGANGVAEITAIVRVIVTPGSVTPALKPLRMATKMDPYRPSAKVLLEPWIVEEALARFGTRRLPLEQQRVVVQAVRTPHKVRWPDWWKVRA